jgi:tetratricopeptide (TPR) repeat protein
VSTFYTREYYRLCRDHLNDGGLVSQWIPLHNGLDIDTIRGLFRTFLETFPESTAWFINADVFLIGSNQPLHIDYSKVQARLAANPQLRDGLNDVYLPDAPELLSGFLMGKDALQRFAGDARTMSDDLPWAEFVAPKLIFKADVKSILEQFAPLQESILPWVNLPAGADGETVRTAIALRQDAHRNDFKGLQTYYGSGPVMSSVDEDFRKSLEIDPLDANAKYYLAEVLLARGQTFTGWDEMDKALPALEEARRLAPHRPEVFLALGKAYDRLERGSDAAAAYRTYLELGGRSEKVVKRFGAEKLPDTR